MSVAEQQKSTSCDQSSKMLDEILIVDDEESILRMLSEIFTYENYSVRCASNGLDGLKAVHEKKPTLLLLDLMMPGISGLEVCKELKTKREYSLIPIVMLTAKKTIDDRVSGLRVGANEYITKPFDTNDLLETVKREIEKARKLKEEDEVEFKAKFEINSEFTHIKQVNELVMRLFRETELSENEIVEFEYCLNEALMNAIEHGSKLDPSKIVSIAYILKKEELILNIEDQGRGFDFQKVPDPTTSENILNPRGRGIFIMKNYMDDVKYNEKGTRLTLTKYLNP